MRPSLPPEDWRNTILATGPLTGAALAEALRSLTGADSLAFFDAIAPIVYRDSIDFAKAWYQSRYDKGGGSDYINCPLARSEYENLVDALLTAEKVPELPRILRRLLGSNFADHVTWC